MQAYSFSSERIFSKAEEIVCHRRASLKPSIADALVFHFQKSAITRLTVFDD
jgi:hypothetical protein